MLVYAVEEMESGGVTNLTDWNKIVMSWCKTEKEKKLFRRKAVKTLFI